MKQSKKDSGTQKSSTDNIKTNSSKATGPKTGAGKRRVRYNALRHGFYSKQLIIQETDKTEFEELRKSLLAEFEPKTTMQMVAFERLLCAIWRVRQALRIEERNLKLQAGFEDEQQKKKDDATSSSEPPRWYTSGRGALGKAIRLVTDLRMELIDNAGLHLEEHREWIVKTLGSDFYDSLANWRPESKDVILLAEQLTRHADRYKMPLPETLAPKDASEKLVVDQRAKWDMMIKLIDVKLQDLTEIYRLLGRGTSDQSDVERRTAALDLTTRYITGAVREVERAADWYLYLVKNGL